MVKIKKKSIRQEKNKLAFHLYTSNFCLFVFCLCLFFQTMPTPSNLGGGPFKGYVTQQTQDNQRNGESSVYRKVLRDSWSNTADVVTVNGTDYYRITTPFRAVNNSGDFLGRMFYSCGGPNPTNPSKPGYGRNIGSVPQHCDGTQIVATTCNPRFVADSSDYVRFKKLRAIVKTYDDKGYGGYNNGSYVPLMHVRRF